MEEDIDLFKAEVKANTGKRMELRTLILRKATHTPSPSQSPSLLPSPSPSPSPNITITITITTTTTTTTTTIITYRRRCLTTAASHGSLRPARMMTVH
jgi:hypothetical protein